MNVLDQYPAHNVFVGTMRGRADAWQWTSGRDGVLTENLMLIDLKPSGRTWMWEPLGTLLTALSSRSLSDCGLKQHALRIFLLDLSGSMIEHQALLKRMWAAIPRCGMYIDDMEIMIVTDGKDNDSAGEWAGNAGLGNLLRHATKLGFNCGLPCANPVGKLHVSLLGVGKKPLKCTEDSLNFNVSVLETQDLELLARVIDNGALPSRGRLSYDSVHVNLPLLPNTRLEEITALELHLGRGPYKLNDALNYVLRYGSEHTRELARIEMIRVLEQIIVQYRNIVVNKRGPGKQTYHTEVNSLLYHLQKSKIVALSTSQGDGKLTWTRGPAYRIILQQVEELIPPAFDKDAAVAEILASEDPTKLVSQALKRYPDHAEDLLLAVVQEAKRLKQ